jgi:hypothetical protein
MTANSKPAFLANYDSEDEAAAGLGICTRTLRNWRRDKCGPPVTLVGNRPYYFRPSVEKWLRSQERAAKGSTSASAA